jgi:hypothetical protein
VKSVSFTVPGAPPERDIQREALRLLRAWPGVKTIRVNAGTARGGRTKLAEAGTADIVACVRGRFVGFEIKTAKGALRESQVQWQAELEAAGGAYVVVRSVADVEAFLRGAINVRGTT